MADEEDEASKTEDPSERKLTKAREEGNVPISQEVKNLIMLIGTLSVVWLIAPYMMKLTRDLLFKFIESPEAIPLDYKHGQLIFTHVFIGFLKIIAAPLGLLLILGVVSSVSQTGFMFNPEKLEPKWEKLNIFGQFKEFFSSKKIMEGFKGIAKVIVIALICAWMIAPKFNYFPLLPAMEVYAILDFIHEIVVYLIFTVVIAISVVALIDYGYQFYTHRKKLRMSKQEMKDEYKQTKGDPLIKSRIRSLRNERARRRMMDNVPKASVVITNPTHYSVALQYELDVMDAPRLVAKGVDSLAFKIREVAEENDVPILENPPLARALYASVEIDQAIPPEHFKAVAEVIGYVMRLKNELPS